MKLTRRTWFFAGCVSLLVVGLLGFLAWLLRPPPEPEYAGRRLSLWAEELCQLSNLSNVVNPSCAAAQAVRAIGTNAIPWALDRLIQPPSLIWRLNHLLQKQSFIGYRLPVATDFQRHRLRARAVFWALGDAAEPAILPLRSIVEKEPDLAPSALAGVGLRALPALEYCLTNTTPAASSPKDAKVAAGALGALYVAIDLGRIPRSDSAFLLPTVRKWQMNSEARYWADGVVRQFGSER